MIFRIAALILVGLCHARAQSYFFIQMSDPQFGMYSQNHGIEQETINFEFAIATANRLKPAFVVITGDLVNQAGDREQIAELKRIASKLDPSIPLYLAPGNHDIGNEPTPESLAAYRERFGRDYYTFRSHDMEGFVLNGTLVQAPRKAPEEAAKQEQWARQELAKAKRDKVAHLVVFIHQPFFLETADEPGQYFNIPAETRRRWLALFHEYGVEHVYAGHYHRNSEGRDGSVEMVTTGPVGMPLGPEGSGIRIVTVRDGVFESHYYGFGAIPGSLADTAHRSWSVVAGGPDGMRFSALSQIDRQNVGQLKLAWKFDTGDEFPGSEMQSNPIVVDGLLFATTPKLRVIALDAATGALEWSFDPYAGEKSPGKQRNRGVTYWADGSDRRVFVAAGEYLYAVNAATGKPVATFGNQGRVDLREGLGRDPHTLSVGATSPGIVYKDLLIMGSIVSEDLPAAPGHIRAYDVRTGAIRWTFHTVPQRGEFGYETWPKDAWTYTGGANAWAGLTLDEDRGLVFAPTGSAAFDFYGANRTGDNLFANCLIALKAATGERVWHYQFVRHDVWDRDLPAPPTLVRVNRNGTLVDAIAQITKAGFVWVFDRDTGKPLFPVESRAVPASDVDGEVLAREQVLPAAPAPYARQQVTEDLLTNRTPEARAAVLDRFRKLRSGPQFTPPSFEGTIVFPGFDGGGEWGGAAFDPASHLLYVNSNEMAWVLRLVPRNRGVATARALYLRDCSGCHRRDLAGTPPEFPSLVNIGARLSDAQMTAIIRKGAGRMPAFSRLSDEAVAAVVRYLRSGDDPHIADAGTAVAPGMKYGMDGYNKFLDPDGYPGIAPPWGTLNAINLDTGDYAWKIPFGEFPELAAKGLKNTGTENYGGPVATAGGLLFIGATNHDHKFHAYDSSTGKLLWETELSASGNATPAVYESNGREFVVIAAGGGKSGARSGGSYYAFALTK